MNNSEYDSTPQSPLLAAWARLMIRFRVPVLLVNVLLSALALQYVSNNLVFNTSQEALLASGSVARESLGILHESFGTDEVFLLLIEGDVFTLEFLDRLRALHEDLEHLEVELPSEEVEHSLDDWGDFGADEGWGEEVGGSAIDGVTSLINVRDTVWKDGALNVGGLLDQWPVESDLPALRERVLGDDKWVGNVVDPEGKYAVVVVQSLPLPQSQIDLVFAEIQAVVDKHSTKEFPVLVGGPPALFSTINKIAADDLIRVGLLVAGVLCVCMLIIFRRPIGVVGPLGAVGHAVIWTLAVMAWLGMPVTVISSILGPFLLCVGIGGTIHIQTVFRDARREGRSPAEAVIYSLSTTGVPVMLTSLTTAIGLLSFLLASVPAIQSLGAFVALGVMIGFLQALTWVPAVLSFTHVPLGGADTVSERDFLGRITAAANWTTASPGRRSLVLIVWGLALTLALGCVSLINVTHDSKAFLPADSPVIRAVDTLDEHVGGTNTMSLIIEVGPDEDVRDLALLQGMEKLEQHLFDYRDPVDGEAIVTHASGALDVVRESWRALHNGDAEYLKVPDTQRGVNDCFTLFETGSRQALRRVMTVDHRRGLLSLRVKWRDSHAYGPLLEHMERGIEMYIGDMARVRPTGAILNHHSVEVAMIGDLSRSFGGATIVITLLMILMLGDVKIGLLAMIPNLAPIVMVLGSMGLLGINLDVQNLLVASIVIGIAVDDTVHFLHHFYAHQKLNGDTGAAIEYAFAHAGRSIVTTSLVLAVGFATLSASHMVSIKTFAGLTTSAVLWALVSDLFLAPALLRVAYGASPQVRDHQERNTILTVSENT